MTEVSQDDVAWADSCFSKDPDILDNGWNSLKDALLETRTSQSHSSAHENDISPETTKMEVEEQNGDSSKLEDFWSSRKVKELSLPTYNENIRNLGVSDPEVDLVFQGNNSSDLTKMEIFASEDGNEHNLGEPAEVAELKNDDISKLETSDYFWSSPKVEYVPLPTYTENLRAHGISDSEVDLVLQADISSETTKLEIIPGEDTGNVNNLEKKNDVSLNAETSDDFWSSHNVEDVFLHTYNENLKDVGVFDPEVDLVSQAYELEETNEDIFKIWDLDIPPEEDDGLIKQLNKALSESSLEPTSSVSNDSKAWKNLQDVSIDDLISGIADLALSPNY